LKPCIENDCTNIIWKFKVSTHYALTGLFKKENQFFRKLFLRKIFLIVKKNTGIFLFFTPQSTKEAHFQIRKYTKVFELFQIIDFYIFQNEIKIFCSVVVIYFCTLNMISWWCRNTFCKLFLFNIPSGTSCFQLSVLAVWEWLPVLLIFGYVIEFNRIISVTVVYRYKESLENPPKPVPLFRSGEE